MILPGKFAQMSLRTTQNRGHAPNAVGNVVGSLHLLPQLPLVFKAKRTLPLRPFTDKCISHMIPNMSGLFGLLAAIVGKRREICGASTPLAVLNTSKQISIFACIGLRVSPGVFHPCLTNRNCKSDNGRSRARNLENIVSPYTANFFAAV